MNQLNLLSFDVEKIAPYPKYLYIALLDMYAIYCWRQNYVSNLT